MNYNFNMNKIYMNKLETKIKELQDRINRAIAYLEAGKTFPNEDCRDTAEYMQNILLDILKGSDE